MVGQGNLKRTSKAMESQGIKILMAAAAVRKYTLFQEKGCLSREIVQAHHLLHGGYPCRKAFSPGGKFFPLKVTSNFQVIQLALLKKRVKIKFWICNKGMKN